MKIKQALTRVCVDEMDKSLPLYEKLLGEKCSFRQRVKIVELAQVGTVLLMSAPEPVMAQMRKVDLAMLVDSVQEWREALVKDGAVVLEEPKEVPNGVNMTVRHTDGTVAEYVERYQSK